MQYLIQFDDFFLNEEARLSDLAKDLPKEFFRKEEEIPVKLTSLHTCKKRLNNKKIQIKINWNHSVEHDIIRRVKERTTFDSIKDFNQFFKNLLDKIFPNMIGKEIIVNGRYAFYFPPYYNFTVIMSINIDQIMLNQSFEVFVITIIPGDIAVDVVKKFVVPEI
jgi:hypothetical protein